MTERDLSAGVRILSAELREARREAGLTQEELSTKLSYARTMVGMWETGQRTPSVAQCEALDDALGAAGRFARMRREIGAEDARERVAELAKVEAQATAIRAYSPLYVPGLMQTREYMRQHFGAARFSGATDADIDQLVETRLGRQGVLDTVRSYLVLLDEAVLRRAIGDRDIAREQFEHLLNLARRPRITIQLIPFATPAYPAAGPMVILDLRDGTQAVHLENPVGGTTTAATGSVQVCVERFELVRTQAASVPDTISMIQERLRELQ